MPKYQHPMQSLPSTPRAMQTPVDESKLEDEQLFIEPFIGWRSWAVYVEGDRVCLRSLTYKTSWPAGEPLEAVCYDNTRSTPAFLATECIRGVSDHPCPSPAHSCGIHAVKRKEDALQWANGGFYIKCPELRCIGEVKLWGKVYRYTEGYLAQYAYPAKVLVDPQAPEDFPMDSREAVHELRRTYRGVEVRLM